MLDRIEQIDTAAIEELGRIKRDQEVLEGRMAKMQERRDGVSEVVFERVREDYRRRLAAFEEEAGPHKERARVEFAKLQELQREVQAAHDSTRLEKEELEFRHSLGEFPDDEFRQQDAACAERLAGCQVELAAVEALRERFLAAVRSRDELEAPPPPTAPEPPPAEAAAPDAPAPESPASPGALAPESVPLSVPELPVLPPLTEDEGGAVAAESAEGADGTNPVIAAAEIAEEPVSVTAPAMPAAAPQKPGGGWWSGSGTARAAAPALAPPPPPPAAPMWTRPTVATGSAVRAAEEAEVGITRDHFGDLTLHPTGGEPIAEDFDAGPTELLDTTGEGLGWNRAPGQPVAGEAAGDWHDSATDGIRVPPTPEVSPPVPTDDEISGATRILSRPRLIERGNGDGNREHLLALGRTSIGRASDNLVHLLDEAVSRHHAEIVPGPQGYLLRDLGSENGIYVNGERTGEHVLHEGDIVQIGSRTLVFRSA